MRTKPQHLVIATLLALLLHGLLLLVLYFSPQPPIYQTTSKPIQVYLSEPKNKRQLVQVKPPKIDRKPAHADYLSEFNNQVDEETKALLRDTGPSPDFGKPKSPFPTRRGGLVKPKILPDWQDLEHMQAATTNFNDHIDQKVKTGAETALNTFEWKYASYFNRIKENVARIWRPLVDIQIKRYDPAGALIGQQDQLTVVEVTLDTQGAVINTFVKTKSSAFYLDDGALMAFRKASPFPNPPQALFEAQDSFSFSFGFYVNTAKGFALDFD